MKNFPLILIVYLSFFDHYVCATLVSREQSRSIINGHVAPQRRFYVQLHVDYGNETFVTCGGTLIDLQWVLSAAHCFCTFEDNHLAYGVAIEAGDFSDRKGKRIRINGMFQVYTEYNINSKTMDYDLAIIRLDSIMPTEFGQPLRRCTKDYYDSGYDMLVAGLGAINHHNANNRRILPDILIETKIKEIRNCPNVGRNFPGVTNPLMQVCSAAATGNGGTCNGDSGGPVFIADRNEDALCLYACVSFGAVEGCGIKQVDTRVSGYQKWIDDIISGIVPLQDAKNKNYPYCVPQKKT